MGSEPLPDWRSAKAKLETWLLECALAESGGNMAAAGRRLGITKVAVLHAVRRHDIAQHATCPPKTGLRHDEPRRALVVLQTHSLATRKVLA